jgi:hypothetical protein
VENKKLIGNQFGVSVLADCMVASFAIIGEYREKDYEHQRIY